MAVRPAVNRMVAGSNPALGARPDKHNVVLSVHGETCLHEMWSPTVDQVLQQEGHGAHRQMQALPR